jgi:hypothetical protein
MYVDAGAVGGTNAIVLPQFAVGGSWATQIALVNTSTAVATGRISIRQADGSFEFRFAQAFQFVDGLALARLGDGWVYIVSAGGAVRDKVWDGAN